MNPKDESNSFRKKKKNFREKFVPTFKKKIPTWKQIDIEANKLVAQYDDIAASKINTFSDFPLSKRTMDGLNKSGYTTPTEIQRESIGIALRGYDLLGAAKTGSGKTLAFLIPVNNDLLNPDPGHKPGIFLLGLKMLYSILIK
jgi:ATP-dependent RNA helicase DDX10/DBP4